MSLLMVGNLLGLPGVMLRQPPPTCPESVEGSERTGVRARTQQLPIGQPAFWQASWADSASPSHHCLVMWFIIR